VQSLLSGLPFPRVFAGLEPTFAPATLPASIDTAGVRGATAVTVKVQGFGCGGIVTGSGFPVAPDYIVTNAHVVSGTRGHTIQKTDGSALPATVVFFDPNRDVAVLHVPGLGLSPLRMTSGSRGTQGAVIGYPGGGQEQADAAVIDEQVDAQGRDIYNQNYVTRSIWIIQSTPNVIPGNSGGPLVDLNGGVLGVVFAASSSDPSQAYALTDDEVRGDIATGIQQTSSIQTANYACAV
jgi:S1-C subfamily serine protease